MLKRTERSDKSDLGHLVNHQISLRILILWIQTRFEFIILQMDANLQKMTYLSKEISCRQRGK